MPVVVTESESGAVLMVGFMNKNALEKTIQTKEAHYWSRSRQTLWKKGNQVAWSTRLMRFLLMMTKTPFGLRYQLAELEQVVM
ncbi:MAG: hypothetical protein CM15mP86_03500 [Gammaproteobacteria bacterium]|nr:MAG: hypothetical protein CM15mP86_03500 [Gammaproteobacteria bacterium]